MSCSEIKDETLITFGYEEIQRRNAETPNQNFRIHVGLEGSEWIETGESI